ncbi:MAG: hypothetical protein GX639_19095 [Fibrobacter sp.]|nr:hypothetical protein [Fibrobacter sp.]
MATDSTTTVTHKVPYGFWQQQNSAFKKGLLKDRLKDVKDDMIVRIMRKQLEEKYLKEECTPADSNLNDNLQH